MKLLKPCIYPKNIQVITGRSERFERKLILQKKEHFGKQAHQFTTAQEFSENSGVNEKIVTE